MVFQNDILAGASGAADGGYTIDQSIRFNDDDSPTLQRTFGSAGGNTWTFSCWMKRGNLGKNLGIFFALPSVNSGIGINPSDQIIVADDGAATYNTTAVFRDPSAWYHIVFTGNGTLNKVYVNNVLQTLSGSPNIGSGINKAVNHKIGEGALGASNGPYMDGYFSEIVFVDGTELSPTDFGETNDDGVWIPKAYAGTYGTNGFYITGEDSADLGADYSGNANDFTSSGLTASDQVPDSPTDSYCVLNPLTGVNSGSSVVTQANGNLEATMTANYVGTFGTLAANSGKYYFEYSYAADANYNDGRLYGGVVCVETADHSYFRIDGGSFYRPDKVTEGNYMIKHLNGSGEQSNTGTSTVAYNTNLSSASATGGPESGPDIYMVAMDLDNNNLYWGKNGTWYGASSTSGSDYTDATPIAILSAHQGKYFAPAFGFYGATSGTTGVLNCGQDATFGGRYSSPAGDFYYTPPTGFSKLSTANLPTPAIADGSKYFQTTLYTGTGSTLEVNQSENSTFQPDFVWIKKRSGTDRHELEDAVRGASLRLSSDRTDAEDTGGLTSFDADGFTVDGLYGSSGESGFTYAAWQWLAANGTASNTDGSITSTVSANTAGFSIVSYTGNGSSGATIGHGLSQAPEVVITKSRDNGTGRSWAVYHVVPGPTKYAELNNTDPFYTGSTRWNDTAPSSTVVTLGSLFTTNDSGAAMIAYCWHSVEGFSKFGSYTGNGSTDGPFVWCGFRPAYVLIKRTDSGGEDWQVQDNARNPYNLIDDAIYANSTAAEVLNNAAFYTDFLSNGFKIRASHAGRNASGGNYIFMAFAEHPFGGDGVAPVPAR